MRIGIFTQTQTVDELTADIADITAAGFPSAYTPQIFGFDALTALAVVASQVPDIELGTYVVPTFPRHPMMLAAQALTVSQVSGGRLTLGIGLSHQIVMESMLGFPWEKPVRHLREYLSILMPLVHGEAVDVEGETLTAKIALDIPDGAPVQVIVAALGPQMLKTAGTLADGTATWMTGPATVAGHVAPSIRAAAAEAGRPEPRVVVALPVAVTDDEAEVRSRAATEYEMYGYLPSYRAMLDREGAAGPADVCIVGTEDEVRAGIERVFEAGATEFVAAPITNRQRTRDLLATLL